VIVLSLAPIPRCTVNIAVGAVFGFSAMPVIMVRNAIGAGVAFLLARHLFFDRLQGFANGRPRLRTLMQAIDDEGWRLVALLRLGSGGPGGGQNFLFRLTDIPLLTCTAKNPTFCIPPRLGHLYLRGV